MEKEKKDRIKKKLEEEKMKKKKGNDAGLSVINKDDFNFDLSSYVDKEAERLNERTQSIADKRKRKREALQNKLSKNSQDFLRNDVKNNMKSKMADIFNAKKQKTIEKAAKERLA